MSGWGLGFTGGATGAVGLTTPTGKAPFSGLRVEPFWPLVPASAISPSQPARKPGDLVLAEWTEWTRLLQPPTSSSFSVPKTQLLTSVLLLSSSDNPKAQEEPPFPLPL